MFDWLKRRGWMTTVVGSDDDTATPRGCHLSGEYRSLYQYLEHRYANTVVLTFTQIEDLLGFALPERARTDQQWWTAANTGTAEPRYSDAWTLTRRTARPNLLAKNDFFERAFG